MSYVTPRLSITPTPGTCTPYLTRPTSRSSDPLLGELQSCADFRKLERGSLAKPHHSLVVSPRITSCSPKTSISLNTTILPNTRIYVSNHHSSIDRAQLRPPILRRASRHLLRTRTWTMARFVLCWPHHCTHRSERQNAERSQVYHAVRENLMSSSSQDPISTGRRGALLFSGKNGLIPRIPKS